MVTRKRKVLAAGLLVAMVAGIIPPWEPAPGQRPDVIAGRRYAPIWSPPASLDIHGFATSPELTNLVGEQIAAKTLAVEWGIILLATAAVIALLPNERKA
jgi:hypothetical protein